MRRETEITAVQEMFYIYNILKTPLPASIERKHLKYPKTSVRTVLEAKESESAGKVRNKRAKVRANSRDKRAEGTVKHRTEQQRQDRTAPNSRDRTVPHRTGPHRIEQDRTAPHRACRTLPQRTCRTVPNRTCRTRTAQQRHPVPQSRASPHRNEQQSLTAP